MFWTIVWPVSVDQEYIWLKEPLFLTLFTSALMQDKSNYGDASLADQPRGKGVQFPFSLTDRVIIKVQCTFLSEYIY